MGWYKLDYVAAHLGIGNSFLLAKLVVLFGATRWHVLVHCTDHLTAA